MWFVWVTSSILVVVQIAQHCRVLGDSMKQVAEIAKAMHAKEFILEDHVV